jgi:hypothetical protein
MSHKAIHVFSKASVWVQDTKWAKERIALHPGIGGQMKTAAGDLSDTSPGNKKKHSKHTSKELNFLKYFCGVTDI